MSAYLIVLLIGVAIGMVIQCYVNDKKNKEIGEIQVSLGDPEKDVFNFVFTVHPDSWIYEDYVIFHVSRGKIPDHND